MLSQHINNAYTDLRRPTHTVRDTVSLSHTGLYLSGSIAFSGCKMSTRVVNSRRLRGPPHTHFPLVYRSVRRVKGQIITDPILSLCTHSLMAPVWLLTTHEIHVNTFSLNQSASILPSQAALPKRPDMTCLPGSPARTHLMFNI